MRRECALSKPTKGREVELFDGTGWKALSKEEAAPALNVLLDFLDEQGGTKGGYPFDPDDMLRKMVKGIRGKQNRPQ
jgi:hypothetical protein